MNTLDNYTQLELDGIEDSCIRDIRIHFKDEPFDLDDILKSDCKLSTKSLYALNELIKKIPNGEMRPQQVIMINKMSDIIETNNNGLIQAGTGVGKSISYLLPAIIYGQKFFVSTATKQLTSQLTEKDLPLLKKYLFPNLEFAGLQSFSNYICPRKIYEFEEEYKKNKSLFIGREDEISTMEILKQKYINYSVGMAKPEEFTIEGLTCNCDGFTCSGSACTNNCKFVGKSECPVYKLVSQIRKSDVVVTNHAYISQLIKKASIDENKTLGILKDRLLWVCDESHELESYLERALSSSLSMSSLYSNLVKLNKYRESENIREEFTEKESKYFDRMEELEVSEEYMYNTAEEIYTDIFSVESIVRELYKLLDKFKEMSRETLDAENSNSKYKKNQIELAIKFNEEDINNLDKHYKMLYDIKVRLNTLDEFKIRFIPTILNIITNLGESLLTFNRAYITPEDYVLYLNYINFNKDENKISKNVFDTDFGDSVQSNTNMPKDDLSIFATFLNTGDALQAGLGYLDLEKSNLEVVNKNKINIIGVSATVCIEGQFREAADKLGMLKLKDIHCLCEDVGTVFDYQKQGLMYIPQGIPSVKTNRDGHFDYFKSVVTQLVDISNGGALILCTTNEETRKTYLHLQNELGHKYNILSADDKRFRNKNKLVEAFREDKDSVLVGTRGFFQGLDIQGDSLRLLCLNKLPFNNPSIVSTRKDEIATAKGYNAFRVNAVVPTTMLLLQAIGRLIRHTSDKGVVAIFDDRLYNNTFWLSPLVNSLPPFRRTNDLQDVKEFLEK